LRSSSSLNVSPRKTLRDFEETIKHLEKENFDLKLRIFLLEEKLNQKSFKKKERFEKEERNSFGKASCDERIENCIALVQDTVEAITHAERQLEREKANHDREIETLQNQIKELRKPKLGDLNNNVNKNTVEERLSEQEEVVLSPRGPLQEAYIDSMRMYRKLVRRLESRLRWAEEEWKEVIKESKVLKDISDVENVLSEKKRLFTAIFDTEGIYDEDSDDDDENQCDWLEGSLIQVSA